MSTTELEEKPADLGTEEIPRITLHGLPESQTLLPTLDNSPMGNGSTYIFDGGYSPDVENGSSFEFSVKKRPEYRILGNSASGKSLQPRGGNKQEMPKSVFSSTIALPKLKQFDSHRRVANQYRDKPPQTFEIPSYRGYLEDGSSKRPPVAPVRKKIYDLMDSRYRYRKPLSESVQMTWTLSQRVENKIKKKLDFRDIDKIIELVDPQLEEEYIKVCVDVSADEDAYDEEVKDFVGNNAVKEYQKHYKLIEKIQSENIAKDLHHSSLYTNVLAGITKNRLMPLKMDIVKKEGRESDINNK
jgi:hypothetical protein